MIVNYGEIPSAEILNEILKVFGVTVDKLPDQYPIAIQSAIDFLVARRVDQKKIQNIIDHINSNNKSSTVGIDDRCFANVWPKAGLPDEQLQNRSLKNEFFWSKRSSIINRKTRIVSMGSCFAIELAKWLQEKGYSYLVTESNIIDGTNIHASSARWGTIFNSPSFYQAISWAVGADNPPLVIFPVNNHFRDPFREDVTYQESEIHNLSEIWNQHLISSRKALIQAEVVVLTLGLNEVYEYLPTGHYLHRSPWQMNPLLWRSKILSVEENEYFISQGILRLRQLNPSVRLIISLSLDPLIKTFRRDGHVASATLHSKSVLRVAIENVSKKMPEVYYMPSFETVMYPGIDDVSWEADERHVNRKFINKIMTLFEQQFCDFLTALRATKFTTESDVKCINPYFSQDHEILAQTLYGVKSEFGAEELLVDWLGNATPLIASGRHSEKIYQILRTLSIHSKYKLNNLAKELYRQTFPPKLPSSPESGIIRNGLDQNGYCLIEATKNSSEFAKDTLSYLSGLKVRREKDGAMGDLNHFLVNPMEGAFRYYYLEEDLPVTSVLNLLKEMGIIRGISDYIGHPILRNVIAWASVNPGGYSEVDISNSAQAYHFDNDNPTGWTKVFIYLTDVSEDNGPHVFVPGSHKELPLPIARDGRFTDKEIHEHFTIGKSMTGGAGTIIIADTLGMHKGLTVNSGVRVILQVEFVTSLLGGETPINLNAAKIKDTFPEFMDERLSYRYIRDIANLNSNLNQSNAS